MKNVFNSKKLRCGVNATLITVLFIIVVLLVNVFTGILTEKFPSINIDVTENKQFEITKETKEALKSVKEPIEMILLVPDNNEDAAITELLQRYKQVKPDITITTVDINKNPAIAKKYGSIDTYGTLVIEYKDKYETISFQSLYGNYGNLENAESLITNGIVFVTYGEKKTVLFSEGHEENPAYTIAAMAQKNFYNYDTIDITKEKIENCDILVIYSPSVDFTSQEIADLESFVINGGNLQIYLTPEAEYLPNLCEYIKEWGIEVRNEIIAEKGKDNVTQQMFIPVVEKNNYTTGVDSTLYYKYSFKLDNLYTNTKGITLYPVLKTTKEATTLNEQGDTGNIGTHNIAIVSERVRDDNTIAKMLVSGSGLLFDSEDYMYNDKICQSVLMGMLPSDNYVEIPVKSSSLEILQITTTDFIFIGLVILIIAIIILVYGIVIWSKRRKL